MTILQAWKDSFSFFKLKNFTLFLLVTLKSIIEAYKLLFKYWWWLLVLLVASAYVTAYTKYNVFQYYFYAEWAQISLRHFFVFVICLTTRPSLMKKTCVYFRRYLPYFGYIAAGLLLIVLSFFFRPSFYVVLAGLYMLFVLLLYPFVIFVYPAVFPIHIFFLMFFLDSDLSPKKLVVSFYKAFKMSIYNYPLCFFMYFGCLLLCYAVNIATEIIFVFLGGVLHSTSVDIVYAGLLMPVIICTFTNVYIKKVHEQFDIYFKQPK